MGTRFYTFASTTLSYEGVSLFCTPRAYNPLDLEGRSLCRDRHLTLDCLDNSRVRQGQAQNVAEPSDINALDSAQPRFITINVAFVSYHWPDLNLMFLKRKCGWTLAIFKMYLFIKRKL